MRIGLETYQAGASGPPPQLIIVGRAQTRRRRLCVALKITYATMSADNEELNTSFDEAVATSPNRLGTTHPLFINGERRMKEATTEEFSPIDSEILIGR